MTMIVLAVGKYPPSYGGGGLRAHRTYKRLREKSDIELCVLNEKDELNNVAKYTYDGVNVTRVNGSNIFRTFIDVGLFLLLKKKKNINMIHAMGTSHVALAASIWASLLNVPLLRELTVNTDLSVASGVFYKLYRHGYLSADLLIALNAKIEKSYLNIGVPANRIWKRPNPVDTTVFQNPEYNVREEYRKEMGFTKKDVVHLVIARFNPRKNQSFAIDVLSFLPSNHFLILAGPLLSSDSDYFHEIKDKINQYNLEKRVMVFPDFVQQPSRYYSIADCYWVPSLLEGLPNTMLEALCTGLTVVVNKELELDDYIDYKVNGLVSSLYPQEFSEKVLKVKQLGDSFEARAVRSEWAKEKFDSNIIDNKFFEKIHLLVKS
jgi:glycosyltransferase involved in cell wall biosynthesis